MELFPELVPAAPPPPRVLTVTELTRTIRLLLETEIAQVWVQGEVCNYRQQGSGHQYFGLKDDKCQVPCVLFHRPYLHRRHVPLREGMAVQVRGAMTVYEARGQYQLVVELVQPAGVGLLQAKFEALKRQLAAEGLFDSARKRPLPKFPRTVGIVTSPTGAAIQDMLNILRRRAPWVRIVIHPVRVQGDGAAAEIVGGLREFNTFAAHGLPRVDVLVLARGGGSAEDLWAFNEEAVARAIVASKIPVVSAVGHEIDFTIADFAADVRAPTPSAAAELIVPDSAELGRYFAQMENRLIRCIAAVIEPARARLASLAKGALVRAPRQRLTESSQRMDAMEEALSHAIAEEIGARKRRIEALHATLSRHRPDQVLRLRRQELGGRATQLREIAKRALAECRHQVREIEGRLRILSPRGTLERGYSITRTAQGKLVTSVSDVRPGMTIETTVRDGTIKSRTK